MSEARIAEYRGAKLERRDSSYRVLLASIDYPMPPESPAYSDIRIDADGNSWVKPFIAPGGEPHNQWTVFSAEGELLGDVKLPFTMEILRLEADHLVANVRDSLDVEQVQLFRIRKPGRG